MDWFRHDYFAANDIKIRKLLRNYGECAYGAYWLIAELLFQQGGSASAQDVADTFELMSSPNMKDVLAESGLFQIAEDGSWSSKRVRKEIEYLNECRKKKSDAGKKGMASRWGQRDNGVITEHNSVITDDNTLITHDNTRPNLTLPNKEKNISNEISQKKGGWVKPSLSQIQAYCKERKNNVDAEEFYDFYESKGWMVGKNHMKDWRACIRTWEKTHSTQKATTPRKDYSDVGVQPIKPMDWKV